MKVVILILSLVCFAKACEYRTYSFSLNFGVQGSYAEVNYQYPNGPSIFVYRNRQVVQEIYLSDDLGKFIEQYSIEGGFALRGEDREIQFTLIVTDGDFHEVKVFRELLSHEQARDCLMFSKDTFWYGGPEQYNQQVSDQCCATDEDNIFILECSIGQLKDNHTKIDRIYQRKISQWQSLNESG